MEKMQILYQCRVKADYYPENIEEDEAMNSIRTAYDFIEYFTNEERRFE